MKKEEQSLASGETYAPGEATQFLWWLSTAEKNIIQTCTVDRNRYAITGLAVLCTWLFATLAWTYFFSTVIDSWVGYVLLGCFMGFIILCIDRALIKGISSSNKRKFLPVLFRMALAITIGTFMAQPALLYLFDKEIKVQISLDNEQRRISKQHELDSLYQNQTDILTRQKNALQSELNARYRELADSRNAFIAETDGTGGSGHPGLREIAKAKQNEYLRLDSNYLLLKETSAPQIASVDSALKVIQLKKEQDLHAFDKLMNDGFLTRIEALHNLLEGNAAARFRYYLLITILVLIELMPVIAKTLLPAGVYEEKVALQEEMEKDIAADKIRHVNKLRRLHNQLAYEKDADLIHSFFRDAKAASENEIQTKINDWHIDETADDIWLYIKKRMLSRQEN